ncbi:hypothetical protein [Pseudodesulfovibrio sp. zrk46]|uniref:hypothetical protein n=1 Tax=Pseudodesulfovibrio sp. zrk46 TaxID=2725288 RepID=UPI0014495C68|nr:hypothetical protein [Pseudodesulfovibrio sp. zrk46]QJB55127.1 hypothetical protein HFN16_01335 [Pseudodesulfovibrio sp. zrk46]
MSSVRVLVFLAAAMFLFFIGEGLSEQTDIRSTYPHGVVSHQRDMAADVRYAALPAHNVLLSTRFAERGAGELQDGILHIGCNNGPL